MKALTFHVRTIEPVLTGQIGGGDPNSAVGFDFIPGSAMRGALINKYLNGRNIDAADNEFLHLFLDGTVRFLNAYPVVRGKRALPVPLSWRVKKDEVKPVYDFAIKERDAGMKCKGVSKSFCVLWEDKTATELCTPSISIKIHTAREDRQRVTEGDSTIFRYKALDAGQELCGTIIADDDAELEKISFLLPEGSMLSLGKSHLAGYGRVKIEKVTLGDWREYPQADSKADNIIVTLLSDAIIRDNNGANAVSLEPVLGARHENAFVSTRWVGGFNQTWNLPLPQALAIEAGSVFVYKNDLELRKQMSALEMSGIGERRAEGFGRIAIDWNCAEKIEVEEWVPEHQLLPEHLKGENLVLAQKMVNRMMRAELDRRLIKAVNSFNINKNTRPKNAQLSQMRVIARRALSESNVKMILEHLDNMKSTANTQFKQAVIEDVSLFDWLKKMVTDMQKIRTVLNVESEKLPSFGGVNPEFTDKLALEYAVRLIEGVIHKALREANNE